MSLALAELLLIPFVLLPLILLVVAILDLSGRPTGVWEASGQSRIGWILIIVLLGVIGPILYFLVARPKLEASTEAGSGFLPTPPFSPTGTE